MLLAPALRELTPAAGSAFSTQSEPLVAAELDGRTESSYAASALHAMADLGVDGFESATIILPVINETVSLEETVKIIMQDVKDSTKEILIVVCKRTTAQSMATVARLQAAFDGIVRVHVQRLPFLGGAMREAFDLATGSHVVMMASDLETDPNALKTMMATARKFPSAIVTATRWRQGGFQGYSKVKLLCNWAFQRFFSLLYGVKLSDMTFAYRIFPAKLVRSIRWEELRHAFLFETMVKPLRLGVPVIEIPSGWKARSEGKSQNTFLLNFLYFRTGLKTRFVSRQSLLKPDGQTGGIMGCKS
jgi:glycosyltransferase involved in cell wall biosynthesis